AWARPRLSLPRSRNGSGGQAWRKWPVRVGQFLTQDTGFGYGPMFIDRDQRTDQLKTQNEEEEKDAHDFTRAPLGQPAFQPGEEHARENEIYQGEGEGHKHVPGGQDS